MGDISQFATRPHRGDAEGCARAFAHVLEIIVAFAITCTDGGGEQWLESDSAMVSPRAAVACEPWRRFARASFWCRVSDVLGRMLLGSFDLRVSSWMSPFAMRRGR